MRESTRLKRVKDHDMKRETENFMLRFNSFSPRGRVLLGPLSLRKIFGPLKRKPCGTWANQSRFKTNCQNIDLFLHRSKPPL